MRFPKRHTKSATWGWLTQPRVTANVFKDFMRFLENSKSKKKTDQVISLSSSMTTVASSNVYNSRLAKQGTHVCPLIGAPGMILWEAGTFCDNISHSYSQLLPKQGLGKRSRCHPFLSPTQVSTLIAHKINRLGLIAGWHDWIMFNIVQLFNPSQLLQTLWTFPKASRALKACNSRCG